jgi:3-hydroxyacyl-[acyl-carrier-protein] dehydratase
VDSLNNDGHPQISDLPGRQPGFPPNATYTAHMASEPILNFDGLDLSKDLFTKSDTLEVLKQRGTFEMLDGVLHRDEEANLIVGYKEIRKTDWWASDHIPGRPLFPGALMVEGAAQLCTFDFLQRKPEMKDTFIGFGGLDGTRFRSAVEPDCRLIIAGRVERIRSRMFIYYTQGYVDRKLAFETIIRGVVV